MTRFQFPFALLLVMVLSTAACTSGGLTISADDQAKFGARMADRGYWHEARFRWEKVLTERPDDPLLLNNLAVANESLGDFDQALAYYKRAIDLAPRNRQIQQNYSRFAEFYSDFTRGDEPEEEPMEDLIAKPGKPF